MKLEVLVSCMHQKNTDIIYRTNITTDVLIINQTDVEGWDITENQGQLIRIFNTIERGCKWRPATVGFAEQNGRDAELSGQVSL